MFDAFGNKLDLGCKVIGIANTNNLNTFYLGKIINFIGNFVTIKVEQVSIPYAEQYVPTVGDENRVCQSNRLVKI